MRPIQRFGATPEGLHKHLYSVSTRGRVSISPRMEAMCFGTTLDRFLDLLEELQESGAILCETPHAVGRFSTWKVREPAGLWDDETEPTPPPAPVVLVKDESTDPVEAFEDSE